VSPAGKFWKICAHLWRFLHRFLYTNFLHQFFLPLFYRNFLHQFFLPLFYTNFLHQFFLPILYTNFCTPIFVNKFFPHIFSSNILPILHQYFAYFTPIFCLFYTKFLLFTLIFLHEDVWFWAPNFLHQSLKFWKNAKISVKKLV